MYYIRNSKEYHSTDHKPAYILLTSVGSITAINPDELIKTNTHPNSEKRKDRPQYR